MIRKLLCVIAALVLAGCGTGGGLDRGPAPRILPEHGKVVRVNVDQAYVVIECTVLPSEGEAITLYRNNEVCGKIRVLGQRSGNYAVAEISDGRPMVGDWFWTDRANSTVQ